MLDSGATISLIKNDLAASLHLAERLPLAEKAKATGVNNAPLDIDLSKLIQFKLGTQDGAILPYNLEAYRCNVIDEQVEGMTVDLQDYPHLKSVPLTLNYPVDTAMQIDILLGEPYVSNLLTGEIVRNPHCLEPHPTAIKTQLGFYLGGCHSKGNTGVAMHVKANPPTATIPKCPKAPVGLNQMTAPQKCASRYSESKDQMTQTEIGWTLPKHPITRKDILLGTKPIKISSPQQVERPQTTQSRLLGPPIHQLRILANTPESILPRPTYAVTY